jgi:outer-membrane receptor for ferric coprogen and ferric-rhodotorulic acid
MEQQTAVDATLTGGFEWLGRNQEVALGGDYEHVKSVQNEDVFLINGAPIDPFTFDPHAYAEPTSSIATLSPDAAFTVRQYGFYAALRLHPLAGWSFIGGLRDSYIRYLSAPNSGTVVDSTTTGKLAPYGGVVYDINKQYSVYASYADIFSSNANGFTRADHSVLPPGDGVNVELGMKGAWANGALNGSLALFDIHKRGVPTNVGFSEVDPNCCFISGTIQSKGVESELSGAVTRHWQLSVGYTYNENRGVDGSTYSTQTPRHLFKLWTNYRMPGRLHQWSVGGGLVAQSENYIVGYGCPTYDAFGNCTAANPYVPFRISQGFYAVADLRLGFDLNAHWSAALNVNNVFDRVYFQTIGMTTGGNWYGQPRNALLKVQLRY